MVGSAAMAQQAFTRTVKLMGCRFDLTVVAGDQVSGDRYIDIAIAEIARIERLLTTYDEASQTSAINRSAGVGPVKVDQELFDLIQRSVALSELTSGAFDISFASLDHVWRFDGTMTALPSPEEVRRSVAKVGYENIVLNAKDTTVFLALEGMRISFGAIGKGYAAERAKALLLREGVKAGIMNASGDLTAWGVQPNGTEWRVAITNPLNKAKAFAWLPIRDGAVATSGNYEKFVELEGVRYSHIIDPRTGYPTLGTVSVSIFANNAELADALATAVSVLGVEVGVNLVEQIPGAECMIVDQENRVHCSKGIDLNGTH